MADHYVLPPTGSKKPGFFYGYVVVVAALFIIMVMTGAISTYGVFLKPLAAEFGWTRAITAGAYSTALFILGLFFMVTGRLTDRFGPRLVVTVCGVFFGSGILLMSRIEAVWQLYLFYGVMVAVGLSGSLVPMMSTASRWFVKRRGMMTGIVLAGVGVGQMTMPPLATYLIAIYGWRTSYIYAGIASLVLTVVAAQFLRRDPAQIGQLPDGETELKPESLVSDTGGFSLGEALHTRQFWVLCAMYACYGSFIHPTLLHIVPHTTDLGISAMSAASIMSVIGGLTTVGRIGMGSIGDKIGHKRGLILAFILAAVAFLWLQGASELWTYYLFAVAFGFAYGGLIALEAPMAVELFGLKAHGALVGVIHSGATSGAAVCAPLVGRLFDITGSYQLAFIAFAAFAVAGIALTLSLRPGLREGEINDARRSTWFN